MSWYSISDKGLLLRCFVQPGASRDEILGLHDQQLRIRLKASPVDGQANRHLCSYLAKTCSLPKRDISIQRGHGQRRKTILLAGITGLPEALTGLPADTENL